MKINPSCKELQTYIVCGEKHPSYKCHIKAMRKFMSRCKNKRKIMPMALT